MSKNQSLESFIIWDPQFEYFLIFNNNEFFYTHRYIVSIEIKIGKYFLI